MAKLPTTHCRDCNVKLDAGNAVYSGVGRKNRCQDCYKIYRKERRNNNIEKYVETERNCLLKKKYNFDIKRYNELLQLQLNGCAICKQFGAGRQLDVDHDHETNQIRGLLCSNCNTALGLLKEDEEIIWNMLEYLKRTTWSKSA
jgi:Recombination endonuclease VII